MKKIYASPNISLVSFYQSLLEDNGIPAVVKNYYLTGAQGDIPPNECMPELWILDDDNLDAAMALLKPEKQSSWRCECGENIPGEFNQCWKCGKLKSNAD